MRTEERNGTSGGARELRRQMNYVFATALGFFLLSHGGHFYAVDNYTVYLSAEALLEGRLDIPKGIGTVVGSEGRNYGMYPIGVSLLQMPLVSIGEIADKMWPNAVPRLLGPSVSVFYPENLSVVLASLVSPLFGALAIAELWLVGSLLGFSARIMAMVALSAVLSTQLWPASRDSFPQIVIAFCMLAAIAHIMAWRDARFRPTPVAAGCFIGILLLVRPFDAVLSVPFILLYALKNDWREVAVRRSLLTPKLIGLCIPIAIAGLIVAFHNVARFGNPLTLVPAGQTTIAFNNPLSTGIYGLLLSHHRGIVLYSPPVIAGIVGMYFLFRRRPTEASLFAVIILSYVLAYAKYSLWDAGVSWGGRFLVPIVPLALLPIGEVVARGRVARGAVLLLAIAGLYVQLAGTVVDFHRVSIELAKLPKTSQPTGWPILVHWQQLLRLENVDWLIWRLFRTHGVWLAFAYAVGPLGLILYGWWALRRELGVSGGEPEARVPTSRPVAQ